MIKAIFCAIFNVPIAHRPWIAYVANFIPEDDTLALERTISVGAFPRITDGLTDLYVTGSERRKLIVGGCVVSIIIIALLGFATRRSFTRLF
jgi:hypothetical protein